MCGIGLYPVFLLLQFGVLIDWSYFDFLGNLVNFVRVPMLIWSQGNQGKSIFRKTLFHPRIHWGSDSIKIDIAVRNILNAILKFPAGSSKHKARQSIFNTTFFIFSSSADFKSLLGIPRSYEGCTRWIGPIFKVVSEFLTGCAWTGWLSVLEAYS